MFRGNKAKFLATASACAVLGISAISFTQPKLFAQNLDEAGHFSDELKETSRLVKRYKVRIDASNQHRVFFCLYLINGTTFSRRNSEYQELLWR